MKSRTVLIWAILCSPLLAADHLVAAPGEQDNTRTSLVRGVKWPNSKEEGDKPVTSVVRALDLAGGFHGSGYGELVPYLLASPNQEEAGSCLYMSLTGIAEWWLARLNPQTARRPDGPIDLSERYMMNLAGESEEANPDIPDWRTDSIYLFNKRHQSVLNSAYRFTKGWYVEAKGGTLVPAKAQTQGAIYDTRFNWIDQRPSIQGGFVDLPDFKRTVIYADRDADQWNVGVAPEDIVAKVKEALVKGGAPVHVIYNHFGYWHAVMVVGFSDDISNEHCAFVSRTSTYMQTEPESLRKQAESVVDPQQKQALLDRAAKYTKTGVKLDSAFARLGGCHGDKGVFFVRDSIYSSPDEPIYVYDPTQAGAQDHYAKKVILHEYDWLLYLANHFVQISI